MKYLIMVAVFTLIVALFWRHWIVEDSVIFEGYDYTQLEEIDK